MQSFNFRAFDTSLSLREAWTELRSYSTVWKVGFTTLLVVAFVPMVIFVLIPAPVLNDTGALALLALISIGGLYGLFDLYRELSETAGMRRLAGMSGLDFYRDFRPSNYPGAPFKAGYVYVPRALRTREMRFLETGYLRPTFHDRRSNSAVTLTYIRVKLPKALPHMALVRNQGFSLLRSYVPKGEKLTLEGEFGDHFTLFAPEGYAQDALYIFTPDVMARFLDTTASFDCEIVNDEMYFYSNKKLSLLQIQTLRRIVGMVASVLQKFDRQTARYTDDHSSDTAPNRNSLNMLRNVPAIVIVGLYTVLWVVCVSLRYMFT